MRKYLGIIAISLAFMSLGYILGRMSKHPLTSNTIKIVCSIIAASIAIVIWDRQSKLTQLQSGVNIILKLQDVFDSNAMHADRIFVANWIERTGTQGLDTANGEITAVSNVLDFFETISFLVRREALDKEFVWHSFFHWIHRYCTWCKRYIDFRRKDDPARWQDLDKVYPLLCEIEKRHGGLCRLSEDDRNEFINDERTIPNDHSQPQSAKSLSKK